MERIFTLGICAMANKVDGGPMQSILTSLRNTGDFEIIIFPEETILKKPITEWPIVECLIAFYSSNFPLDKAIDYVKRYKPIVLNDVEKQKIFRSRIDVYRELQAAHIPHPNYVIVDHEAVRQGKATFEEQYDYIVYNNIRINKPFIEKAVDSDDHNNWIYYPTNTGGGCKKLFRKVQDRSSRYCGEVHEVRRDGTYIYEEFMSTFGTDIKVYTVGCMFAHAEARKSPTLDGKVDRNKDGKEVRFPVILTTKEKLIAYRIVEHFGQAVCGFDILRTIAGPYVCDINGWSFVKRNRHHVDFSQIIRIMFLLKLQKKYNHILGSVIPAHIVTNETAEALKKTFADTDHSLEHSETQEELCSVVVIMRHGDRKPKQKLKMLTTHPLITQYFENRSDSQIKLKSPEEMDGFSTINKTILKEINEQILERECRRSRPASLPRGVTEEVNNAEIKELNERLQHHKELENMLHTDDGFAGINRKIQLKASYTEGGALKHVLVVAKWGGELTPVGKCQAEDLGRRFRQSLYPTDCSGLIRLHSSYRHDFKIFSSDEGRCQVTSAAFTKGILDLEGELTPILVAMTIRDKKAHMLLDDNIEVKERIRCKDRLSKIMENWGNKEEVEGLLAQIEGDGAKYYRQALEDMNFIISDMHKLTTLLSDFMNAMEHEITKWMYLYAVDEYAAGVLDTLHDMQLRWKGLTAKLRKGSDNKFQFTMIADIVDNLRYDLIHHHIHLGGGLDIAFEIYNLVEPLSAVLSPCEYGVTPRERLNIGLKVAGRLLQKIVHDVTLHKNSCDDTNHSVDMQRDRDQMYATLVERHVHDGVSDTQLPQRMGDYYNGGMSSERLHCEHRSYDGPRESMASQSMLRRHSVEPYRKISLLASTSASAASVAANSLAVGSHIPEGLKKELNMTFIGGIKPGEMNRVNRRTNMEEIWERLHEEGEGVTEPIVINSSALWVHCKAKNGSDRGKDDGHHSSGDEGDLETQEVSEAHERCTRTSHRMVRSRYYVTSASILFSLLNFFKYAHYLEDEPDEKEPLVRYKSRDMHYLSHMVLRVWRSYDHNEKPVYRLEILVSPGAKDGFGQNYDILAENARSQKHKYRRHISRFNLDYVRGKVLCKQCGDVIDPEFVRAQFKETVRVKTTDRDPLKRSASTTNLKMGLRNTSPPSTEFSTPKVRTNSTFPEPTRPLGRWYLCKRCAQASGADKKIETQTAVSARGHAPSPEREAAPDCGSASSSRETSNSQKETTITLDSGVFENVNKSVVPPYCELTRLAVINDSCDLTRLERLVKMASAWID